MKRILPSFFLIGCVGNACACTTFFICKKGEMILGRKLRLGERVGHGVHYQRGLQKTSLPNDDGNPSAGVLRFTPKQS